MILINSIYDYNNKGKSLSSIEEEFKDKVLDRATNGLNNALSKSPLKYFLSKLKKKIISQIMNDLPQIIVLKPIELRNYIDLFENNGWNAQFEKKSFKNLIIKSLSYDAFREVDAIWFAEKLGIKACPYCNAQFTIVIGDEEKKARFHFDHFFPQCKISLLEYFYVQLNSILF